MIIKKDMKYVNGENRMLHIHLPENYYETDERYPVMYFFDGHNLFSDEDATYGKSWGLEDFLNGWYKPMIIVGMECSHTGRDRLSEYCPYNVTKGWLGRIDGQGEETMQWILRDIKPMIDAEFRTYYFREATGIGGSSMGGLMACYAGIRYNRFFSKCACVSPSCIGELKRDLQGRKLDPDSRFWISCGSDEVQPKYRKWLANQNASLQDMIERKGAMAAFYLQEGGTHSEASWEMQVPDILHYLWD